MADDFRESLKTISEKVDDLRTQMARLEGVRRSQVWFLGIVGPFILIGVVALIQGYTILQSMEATVQEHVRSPGHAATISELRENGADDELREERLRGRVRELQIEVERIRGRVDALKDDVNRRRR